MLIKRHQEKEKRILLFQQCKLEARPWLKAACLHCLFHSLQLSKFFKGNWQITGALLILWNSQFLFISSCFFSLLRFSIFQEHSNSMTILTAQPM